MASTIGDASGESAPPHFCAGHRAAAWLQPGPNSSGDGSSSVTSAPTAEHGAATSQTQCLAAAGVSAVQRFVPPLSVLICHPWLAQYDSYPYSWEEGWLVKCLVP